MIEPEPTYSVTVTVEPEGAGTAAAEPTSGKKGDQITLKAAANEGYTFQEWQVISGGVTVAEDKFTLGKEDVKLKAVFKAVTYTVHFDPNGGEGTMEDATVNYGEQLTLPECGFTAPEGQEFDQWDAGKPGDAIDVTGDMTVTAQWKDAEPPAPETYTVKFDPNGGEGTMEDATVTAGEQYTLPECGFTAPEGKEFDQWDAGKPGDKIDVTGDMTIKAQWKDAEPPAPQTFTVRFESNGGSAVEEQTVNENETAQKPANPSKTGYAFAGWYSDKALTKAFDFKTPITANITLYAKWEEGVKYTVDAISNATVTKGKTASLTITVKRSPDDEECFEHFSAVEVDGKELVKATDYSAKAGSTVITFKNAYLNKLTSGTHTVTILFDDGKVSARIVVKAGTGGGGSRAARTGDESTPGLWIALLAGSAVVLAGIVAFLVLRMKKGKAQPREIPAKEQPRNDSEPKA